MASKTVLGARSWVAVSDLEVTHVHAHQISNKRPKITCARAFYTKKLNAHWHLNLQKISLSLMCVFQVGFPLLWIYKVLVDYSSHFNWNIIFSRGLDPSSVRGHQSSIRNASSTDYVDALANLRLQPAYRSGH